MCLTIFFLELMLKIRIPAFFLFIVYFNLVNVQENLLSAITIKDLNGKLMVKKHKKKTISSIEYNIIYI